MGGDVDRAGHVGVDPWMDDQCGPGPPVASWESHKNGDQAGRGRARDPAILPAWRAASPRPPEIRDFQRRQPFRETGRVRGAGARRREGGADHDRRLSLPLRQRQAKPGHALSLRVERGGQERHSVGRSGEIDAANAAVDDEGGIGAAESRVRIRRKAPKSSWFAVTAFTRARAAIPSEIAPARMAISKPDSAIIRKPRFILL